MYKEQEGKVKHVSKNVEQISEIVIDSRSYNEPPPCRNINS